MHFAPIRPDVTARLATVSQKMLSVALGSADPQSPVCQAVIHHLRTPGLRVRSQIALHAADCLGVDAQSALAIATCCELLHNASLIHDDLQDRDQLRRGMQAVWSMFGDDVALCAGDLLLSSAYAALADVTDIAAMPRLVAQTHAAVAQTIRGQASPTLPPHADSDRLATYQLMAAAKSGPLLSLPFGLVFSYCNRPDLVAMSGRAVRAFSIAYQIADDLADFEADSRTVLGAAANIIGVLEAVGRADRATAQARAVVMARAKLAEALAIAAELPHGTAAILSDLAARITYKLDGYQ
jgi:geranylgeranyl pyrophosphate synthase